MVHAMEKAVSSDATFRAALLRDQVMKTWSPPLHGVGRPIDTHQTSTMLTIAWVFGRSFLGELTPSQDAAIDIGLELYSDALVCESLL
jgi:hypothetical protein